MLKQNASNNKTVVDGATYYQYTVIDTDGTINTAKYIDSASILEPASCTPTSARTATAMSPAATR